jgi:putative tricarboxylic transport membrane protein
VRFLSLLLLAFVWHSGSIAQTWKPDRATELIVAAGPGGGNDIAAREIQRIIQANRLTEAVLNVINKPGGGGVIAYNYLNQHPADGHYLAMASPTLLTNHILGINPLNYTDFTPVARLADENLAFVVKADSPIRNGRDLIELLRKDPAAVKFAFGTSRGNGNHIAIGMVSKGAGVDPRKITAVVFKATSEAVVAVQGGHVDVVPSTGATVLAPLKAGALRAIAVTSPQRMTGPFANVPTWKELGIDAVIASSRNLIGPRGMTAPQLAYWDGVFEQLTRTDDWKRAVDQKLWVSNYMPSKALKSELAAEYAEMKAILTDLGLVKQ